MLASVSWAGFVMTKTALDPSRSERLADQVFDNEQLRSELAERLATGMAAAIPGDIEVPPEIVLQAANLALDDPAVQALVRDGIVATHRNALEGNSEPTTIDASALGSATRNALVSLSPQLDAVVPAIPPVEVTLPTGGLSILGKIRGFVETATTICGALALVGALSALVLTTNRPAILRRVATWALGAAAFWLVIAFGVPWLAAKIAPSSSTIIAAIIDVFFGAIIPPAITLGIIGACLFGTSFVWSAAADREPRPRQNRTEPAQVQQQQPAQHQRAQHQTTASSAGVSSNIRPPREVAQPAQQQQAPLQQPVQYQEPGVRPEPDPWSATAPAPGVQPDAKRHWVEGVGYVEGEEPPAQHPPTPQPPMPQP